MKKRRAMNAAVSRPRNKKSVFAAIGAALISMLFVQGCTVAVFPPAVAGKPYVRLYGRAGDTAVWIVNGPYIRQNLDEEFTNFGQHYGFRFIPKDEFWLDNDVLPGEREFILLHEMHERHLMSLGWKYAEAHADSSRIEYDCRRHPERLEKVLRAEVEKNR
jgi:hypothetical protein